MPRSVRLFASSALVVMLSACVGDAGSASWPVPDVQQREGALTVSMWVCRVPSDTTATEYGGLPLRHEVDAAMLVTALAPAVTEYLDRVSHGSLQVSFVAGGEVTMAASDGPQQCVAAARARTPATKVVLAVADAEHAADQPGGFGAAGDSRTEGAAYVGGNDIAGLPDSEPPLDLIEHELGHALGWVHSGYDGAAVGAARYRSALDVMSDSAWPRTADATRRDGPDILAIDRLLVGWIPLSEVEVIGTSSTSVRLRPSTGPAAVGSHRVAVLPVSTDRFATIEVLEPSGYDAHLPHGGVAVHLVTVHDGAVTDVQPLHADPPFTDLLVEGDVLEVSGRTIRVGATVDGVVTVVVDAG